MQLRVSQEVPHTGMAVTIDSGHATDVHPRNKRVVGNRLALLALEHTYKHEISGTSPTLVSYRRSRDSIVLTFSHSLTTSDHELPAAFKIAGNDRLFHDADATIDDRQLHLSSSKVGEPVAVRYAWANNPTTNLIGTNRLPVSPFRTDDWPYPVRHPPDKPLGESAYRTGFENIAPGPLDRIEIAGARWQANSDDAQITAQFAHHGNQSLHLKGGRDRTVSAKFASPIAAGTVLSFQAERWTRRTPYKFRIEALQDNQWMEMYRGDDEIRVGTTVSFARQMHRAYTDFVHPVRRHCS